MSFESRMACGIGACMACVAKDRKEADLYHRYLQRRTGIPDRKGGILMDLRVKAARFGPEEPDHPGQRLFRLWA